MSNYRQFKTFHGKIMVFGEYSVLTGSGALLLPYNTIHASLAFPVAGVKDPVIANSNHSMRSFAGYLGEAEGQFTSIIDVARFKADLAQGLYLNSTIPVGYGLGSSGALCAAVYEEYGFESRLRFQANDTGILGELKSLFSHMETYFHGSSSGVDPLCIFLDKAILVKADGNPDILDSQLNPFGGLKAFLLNTNSVSFTRQLVDDFHNQMSISEKRDYFISHYVPSVSKALEQLIEGSLSLEAVLEVSLRQLMFFGHMIPESHSNLWRRGIESGLYACKLCGSGGGGMVLGFTRDIDRTGDFLRNNYNVLINPLN